MMYDRASVPAITRSLLVGTLDRPGLYRRNGVWYLTTRGWRSAQRPEAILALRQIKAINCPITRTIAVNDVIMALRGLYGELAGLWVTSVPCGHSCRTDCFGKLLARDVARALGLRFSPLWADQNRTGGSHPRESSRLSDLEWLTTPDQPVLIIDDVATSGAHLEQAVMALRAKGLASVAVAWIGGESAVAHTDLTMSGPLPDGATLDAAHSLRLPHTDAHH